MSRAQTLVQPVREQRLLQLGLGTRKLYHVLCQPLKQLGLDIGRDAMFNVLRLARLLVQPRRAHHKTTDSHLRFRRHPKLLKPGDQQVTINTSEQVRVADITYLPTAEKFVYLS